MENCGPDKERLDQMKALRGRHVVGDFHFCKALSNGLELETFDYQS